MAQSQFIIPLSPVRLNVVHCIISDIYLFMPHANRSIKINQYHVIFIMAGMCMILLLKLVLLVH